MTPLFPTPSENTRETLLALPDGFRYNVLGRAGTELRGGGLTPPNPDGMAAFASGSHIRLVRNHEILTSPQPLLDPAAYDALAGGGTTTLVIDPARREVVSQFFSLVGTGRNCSGGATPWGTWISCEETVAGPGGDLLRPHGYCFEVDPQSDTVVPARPLKAMGRFVHEAAAVDPGTGQVYMTEDSATAGLYRFTPVVPGRLGDGGKLQMLGIDLWPLYDAADGQTRGAALPVRWIDIGDPDPIDARDNPTAVFTEGRSHGGARFRRLEGASFAGGSLFFASTTGGDAASGQIWEYRPKSGRRRPLERGHTTTEGTLRLVYESPGPSVLKSPDNLCMTPSGSLLLCEDSTQGNQMLRALTPDGDLVDVAMNVAPGFEVQEFAGATFSPAGDTLFVNLFGVNATLAIWGPWHV